MALALGCVFGVVLISLLYIAIKYLTVGKADMVVIVVLGVVLIELIVAFAVFYVVRTVAPEGLVGFGAATAAGYLIGLVVVGAKLLKEV